MGNIRKQVGIKNTAIAIAHLSDSVKRKVKPEGFCSEINVVTRAGMKEILSRSSITDMRRCIGRKEAFTQ